MLEDLVGRGCLSLSKRCSELSLSSDLNLAKRALVEFGAGSSSSLMHLVLSPLITSGEETPDDGVRLFFVVSTTCSEEVVENFVVKSIETAARFVFIACSSPNLPFTLSTDGGLSAGTSFAGDL